MKNQKPLFLLLALFLFVSSVLAGTGKEELKAGWDLFAKNDYSKAIDHFNKAAADPATADDANISIAMLNTGIYKTKLAGAAFNKYLTTSKNPNPALFALESAPFIRSLDLKESMLFYENIVKNPAIDETGRCMAYERLAGLYELNGDVAKGRATADKIGSIQDWSVLGTFENLSGSGYNKDYGAIAHPELTYSFKNKINAEVNWFVIPKDRIRNDRWIDFEYYFSITNSIVYAQTYVTSPADIECQFRLGTSGSYKIWINDHLIMSDPEERNNDLDTYISTAKLSKGVNRIMIQLGSSEITNCNFMCRFTDNTGKLIPGLAYSPTYLPYNKTYEYAGTMIPINSEEFYKAKVKEDPTLLLNYLLLANCYLRNDKSFDAAHVLRDGEKLAPECVYLLALKAEQASRAKNYPGTSTILKKLKEVNPDSYDALQLEYQEMVDGENWDKAEEVLTKIKNNYGEDESTIEKQITIYGSTKQIDKMISAIEDAYKQYPDNYTFVNLKFLIENKVRKNNSEAEKVLKKYIDKRKSTNAMGDLLDQYMETGNVNGALSMLEKMIDQDPYAIGYLSKMARIQYSLGNYKKSHEYNQLCHSIAPYIGGYDELAGDIFDAEKKPADARQSYKRAIVYSPTNYDAREKLRKLDNKPEIFEPFGKPDFQKIYKSAPSSEAYPEDNSIILVDEDQKVIYKGGASVERSFLMVKVFNTAGIDNWKEYNVPQYSGQRLVIDDAYIIKKNGSKVDADKNENQIAFTTLEVGDAICVSYKIENYYTGKLAQHFSEIHYFNYFLPVMRSAYQLLVDTSVTIYYKTKNSSLQPQIKNLDEFKLYSWVETNKPALKSENSMPEIGDIAPSVRVTTFKEWDDVSKWYSEISSSKAKPDYELKELMHELFDGKGKMTDLQKAKYMYDYIVREIRYSSVSFRQSGLIPQSTSNVLNSKMGDCKDISTLFVAMCREAGIDANLTLVNTRDNGDNNMYMPCIDFDHCIAAININSKKYYVELTNDCNPFSTMSGDLYYAQALEVRDQVKNDLIHLPKDNAIRNSVNRQTKMTVAGEKITVQKKTTKFGINASYMRNNYRDIGKEQQEKNLKESINDEYPSVHLDGFHFDDNLKSTIDSITYEFTYSSKDAINDVGGMQVFKIPFSESITSLDFLTEEARTYPIVSTGLLFNSTSSETITLSLPAGASLLKVPEAKSFTSDFGDYSLTYKISGATYIITRKFTPKGNGQIPIEKYADFKAFFEKIIKADAVQLALK